MTQEPQDAVPFKDSYWAVERTLLAGPFPNDHFDDSAIQMLEGLLDVGVRHIINLTDNEETDCRGDYEPQMRDIAAKRNQEVTFTQFQIPGHCVPTVELMQAILDDIDNVLSSKRGAVYVHCWAGRGRTGTVVGCFLARHGMAVGESALKMVAFLRNASPKICLESPETEEQRDFVRQWKLDQ